jgi:acyl-CoA synthetase (AMP-forming)/AMP-acid ligase II
MALLIGSILSTAARSAPRAIAATLGEEARTFADLDAAANRTAHALEGLGVARGDIVAWWTGPSLRSLEAMVATARLGAVLAPLNPALGSAEVSAVVEYLAPRLLVSDGDRAEMARDTNGPFVLDAEVEGRSDDPPRVAVDERDAHVVYLTSGSTGRPKGVVVSQRASWLRSWPGGATFTLGLQGGGGILTSFPLFHYGGWHYVFEAWHQRRPLHVVNRADAAHLLDAIRRWAPAGVYCIPAVWGRILDDAGQDPDDCLSGVRQADTGTSATPPELLNRLRRRMPAATTSVFYGSTEAGHHTTLPDWDVDDHPGSVGRAAPGVDIRIGNDEEICVRAETLMDGYHNMPAPTAAVLHDGWYHTGDAGYLDDHGYLYITGRLREVIRTGGETVGPGEVEAAVRTYPGVRDAAVVGLADQRWGEIVCAVVVMDEGVPTPALDALRSHLRHRLAPHKHPRRIVAVATLPRTAATGQLQRSLIRETLAIDPPPTGGWR